MALQTFYFDVKDGVPIRDRVGMQFKRNSEAIAHSKEVAARLRQARTRSNEPGLIVSVLDESGREIHQEVVHRFPSET